MPTVNPRINVTLSESLDDLIGRFARLQRVSKSQVVRELLETAEPALSHGAALMEAAAHAAKGARATLRTALDATIQQAEAHSAQHLAQIQAATDDLVSQAQAVRGRRPRRLPVSAAGLPAPTPEASGRTRAKAAPERSDPLPSNRGVNPPSTASKRAPRGVKS